MDETIVKRRDAKEITDAIFGELQAKYGDNDVVNGVMFKQDLEFFRVDVDDINDSRFMEVAEDYPECGTVYLVLRTFMLTRGFYLPYSQLDEKHLIRQMRLWVDNDEKIKEIIQKFIDIGLLAKVNDPNGVPCLIEPHQLFNYELAQKKRKEERERKRDFRAAQKKNIADEKPKAPVQVPIADENNSPDQRDKMYFEDCSLFDDLDLPT